MDAARKRDERVRPAMVVLGAGIALALLMQLAVREGVFYSGDGGVKYLATEQFARGEWTSELRLTAEPWVRALWNQGHYPIGPPFVYDTGERRVFGQPLAFPAATAPFLAVLGYRGLYALPLLSLAAIAILVHRLVRLFRLSPEAGALAHAGWILASNATLYSAIFWEHLPAVALAFGGLSTILEATRLPVRPAKLALAGACLGAGAWLRPELLVLGVFAAGLGWPAVRRNVPPRAWLAFCLPLLLAVAAFLAWNKEVYGHPLGAHALQVLHDPRLGDRPLPRAMSILVYLAWKLVEFAPATALALVAATRVLRREARGVAAPLLFTVSLSALFLATIPFVLPNRGGVQWGPRYVLGLVPPLCFVAALGWDDMRRQARRGGRILLAFFAGALISWGIALNSVGGPLDLVRSYRDRVLPLLDLVRRSGVDQIVVGDQHVAQEMAFLMNEKRFYRLAADEQRPAKLAALADAFLRAGRERFLFIMAIYEGSEEFPAAVSVENDRVRANGRFLGKHGAYYHVFEFRTSAKGGSQR